MASWMERPMQRFVLALFFVSALGLAAFSRGEGSAPLAVVLATPSGDVRQLYSIDVSFDAPMVKLGERGRAARNVLKLEPSLKGTATWLGTRALSFQLDAAPAPGTTIQVTIPKGTKSLDGRALPEDLRWTIEFQRPRLLASSPAPAPNTQSEDGMLPELGNFPVDDPILLLFDQAPRADAARAVTLWRWSGEAGLTDPRAEEVALDRYDPKPSELDDLADRLGKEKIDPAKVIGLKARSPLDADHIYQVRVAGDLPFATSRLGLSDAQHILFRTLGEPGVREVSAGRDYLAFTVGSATHPDTLLKYLKLDPPVRRMNAWETGENNLWVEGRLPAGRKLQVTVPAGLPDLFGRRARTSFTQSLLVPHDAAWLEIEPSSGAMMPGSEEAVEIEAENVEAVTIKGLWLPLSEGPTVTSRLEAEDLLLSTTPRRNPASWTTRWMPTTIWKEPASASDSTLIWRKQIDELPTRPADASLLYLEASAIARFPESEAPETLRTSTLLQLTSLGITARMARNHGLLWITDLNSGQPIAGARVSLWDGPDALGHAPTAPLWKGVTDNDGLAWTPGVATLAAAGVPRYARCETKDDRAFLALSIYDDWNLEELRTPAPPAAALWTDRPLYRPGDRIEWKVWLRDVDAKGLALSKLKSVEVRLNDYEETPQKAQANLSSLGSAGGHFVLPQNARTGYYTLEVVEPSPDDNGRTLGSIGVQVEEYRAPRFQAKVEARPRLILSGGTAEARGEFRYFAGGALGGQPVRWFLSLSPSGWQPPGWDGYSFSDEPPVTLRPSDGGYQRKRGYEGPAVLREGQATLDKNGVIDLEQTIVLPPETPDSYLSVEIGARDLADQSAFDSDGLMVVRGPLRVGVHTLWDEPEERSNEVSWEWAVVDTAGVIRAGIPATAELWRQDYKTARVRRLGGLFDYENFPADTLISRHELTSGAEASKLTVRVPGPGDYRLRVTPKLPGGELIAASARAWVAGPEVSSAARPTTWWLSLDTEKGEYAPSDTVRLVIPAPVGGAEALVLLESGDLIRARHVSLSGTPKIEVPLLGLAPGSATIDAVLVGPDKVPTQPTQDSSGASARGPRQFLPYHARGNAYFNVSNGSWEAKLELHAQRENVSPGDSLGVDFVLTDAKGAPSAGEITLAVVDEAVLALVGDRAANPLSQLFGARHGQVIDDDLRTQLRLSPSLDKGKSSPGGGGAEAKSGLPTRANFRATAYWNASIPVGPDGRAHVSVPMPDDLTRYRLRAVAVTKKSEFAEAEGHVTVSRALEVEAAAPRFVRAGDAWTLGAVVRNRSGQALEVNLRASVTGARLVRAGELRRRLAAGENWRADFPIDTPSSGTVGYTLEVSSTDGRYGDRVARHLPAALPLQREVEVAFGVASPKGSESIDLADPGLRDGGALTIAASPTLLGGLAAAVDYLTGYPHGCLEQIDSQILGLLTRRSLLDRLPPDTLDAPALDRRVAAGLAKIDAQYTAEGFRLWSDSGPAGAYLNAYTLWTLARAAASGVALPDGLLERADQLLANDLERTEDTALDPDSQALLSWLRLEASSGDAVPVDDAALEKLYTYADELGTAGKMALALAYDRYEARIRATTKLRPAAEKELRAFAAGHIKGLVDTAAQSIDRTASQAALLELHPGWGAMYSSSREDRVRATALAALLLSRRDPNHPLLPLFVRWLLLERRHGRWGNTHENAWALTALTEYAAKAENLRFPIEARVVLGLGRSEGARFEAGKLTPFARRYGLDELLKMRRADPSKPTLGVEVETGGQSPIFYDLRLDRVMPALALPAREEGLTIYREYTTVDGVPLKKLTRGEPVLAHLAVVVPQASDYLVIEDPLPAGCEAVNLDFKVSSRTLFAAEEPPSYDFTQPEEPSEESDDARLPVSHRELRDDRARFYADEVGAGIYHLYYPITPTTPGRFGTPGARAELLYSPEVYATSGTDLVTVE